MSSFRVFVWPRAARLDLVAFEQSVGAWPAREEAPDWDAALADGRLLWLSGAPESVAARLQALDGLLPTAARVHAFVAPAELEGVSEPLEIRGKKCLRIPLSSGLKDWALLGRFFDETPVDETRALSLALDALAAQSDREIEMRLRRFGAHPLLVRALEHDPSRRDRLVAKAARPQKLLLHICCGPDAAGVVRLLKEEFDLTCFWYDPNIQPRQEHDKRLEAFEKVMRLENVPYLVGEYDVDAFLEKIRCLEHTPEQGAKCSKCYDMRLERAAFEAREGGYDLYATTLAISPHKVQQKLVAFGDLNEKRYGVPYFHRNFMKDDGFVDSVSYTKQHGIFRQDYCGCWFSLHEGGPAARWLGAELGLTKDSRVAPATLSDKLFKDYEARLDETPESGYSGG
jgi:predicted adenine nucleotide alpha hydrolase (AANH) superfamily ATPase